MTRFYFFRSATVLTLFVLLSLVGWAQLPTPTNSVMSDIKPGSILFFPKYSSNPSSPQLGDTQINITNTSANRAVSLHLFAVDGSSCSVADSFVSLTANQTASFLMSDFDPGVTGYLMGVASDGGPTKSNFLIGSEYIRETDGRSGFLQAYTVAKISDDPAPDDGNGGAQLIFNGIEYERLPSSVGLASFNSQVTDNTQINILSPSGNYIDSAAPSAASLFTLVYDDAERSLSTSVRVICYTTFNLSSLRVSGGLNNVVSAGRTGWIRFSNSARPIMGAALTRGPVFTGGHNLHILGLLNSYTITVPNF
ncbi:MAG: hypothetical protein HOP19_21890 [Acidobacteria bacterium]|nr:hypothetical protein [Acidobacteriota bacterium]